MHFNNNKHEKNSFIKTALTWNGSVTPKVLHRVLLIMIYSFLVSKMNRFIPLPSLSLSPFQYTGFALSVLLVLRINAGLERWWEARKLWGQIVNQSRNLAVIIYCYCSNDKEKINKILNYISCWPYIIMSNLRNQEVHPKVYLLANMTEFGKTPYIPFNNFKESGYNCVIYPVSTLRIAMKAIDVFLDDLVKNGTVENSLKK